MKVDLSQLTRGPLVRGRVIKPDEVGKATGMSPNSTDYGLACLRLRNVIQAHLRNTEGLVVSIRIHHGELHILTDQQQARYTARKRERGVRTLRRSLREAMGVNARQLTSEEQAQHHRTLATLADDVGYLGRRRRGEPIPVEPHQDSRPSHPGWTTSDLDDGEEQSKRS